MRSEDLVQEQVAPVPNGSPSVQSMVREDLVVRERLGVERYGTTLQPGNGRDALRDLYEELLDGACYVRQAIEERPREDVDVAVAEVRAGLETELQRKDALLGEMRRQLDAAVRGRDRYVESHRRLERVEWALGRAGTALAGLPQTCRYHGAEFGDTKFGEPACESCRLPYRVSVALKAIGELGVV
ncbi:hypothetical protein [Actinoplanes sp. NBRC 101535]|uniref:hypothetical protein n=1 Tax=Actinoplanes sp. NBRC 101535 TaxID=3032196 RepID=UPI0024A575D0|nr:hypothetical protein [Actinoplanes sp. NBRC 101535]GLY08314.1 hypothetical protein Acsp01_86930 [Actinoplanes sp. NBRC 101535]